MLKELKKFHKEHEYLGAPLVTSLTKKRLRVPHPNPDENPFCMERQLADEYEQLNFNKNPRFYINTIKNSPRIEENPHNHSSFINKSADLMSSSGFSPRIRAEFTGSVPPVAYRPNDYITPEVVSVDSSGLRSIPKNNPLSPEKNVIQVTSKHAPPIHNHYSAVRSTQPVSFGHRPESASRMYDPLTSYVVRAKKAVSVRKLAPVEIAGSSARTGMTAAELQELLTPTKQHKVTKNQQPASPNVDVPERPTLQHDSKEKALDELERGFDNKTYYPPKAQKPFRFPPPTDQTTAQLIDKFRKLAVGKMPDH